MPKAEYPIFYTYEIESKAFLLASLLETFPSACWEVISFCFLGMNVNLMWILATLCFLEKISMKRMKKKMNDDHL